MEDAGGAVETAGAEAAPSGLREAHGAFVAELERQEQQPDAASTHVDHLVGGATSQWDDGRQAAIANGYAPFADALDSLDPEERDAMVQFAQMYAADPEHARFELASAFGFDVGQHDPVTADEVAYMIQAQEAARAYEAQIEQDRGSLRSRAQQLGIDPASPDYQRILTVAIHNHSVDEQGNPLTATEALEAAARTVRQQSGPARRDEPQTLTSGKQAFRQALEQLDR